MTGSFILDVDGTLWDTTELVAAAWNRAIGEVGGTSASVSSAVLKREFGKTMETIADDLFPDAGADRRKLLLQKCCSCEQEILSAATDRLLYPGVRETIGLLSQKSRLFIVSNCQSGYIELFLEKAGVGSYITDYECFGNTGMDKEKNIRLLMERNGLEKALYVGDTQGDREAAASAGIPFVFASYGFGRAETPDFTIGAFGELLDL